MKWKYSKENNNKQVVPCILMRLILGLYIQYDYKIKNNTGDLSSLVIHFAPKRFSWLNQVFTYLRARNQLRRTTTAFSSVEMHGKVLDWVLVSTEKDI